MSRTTRQFPGSNAARKQYRRTSRGLNAAPMLIGLSLAQCIADIVNGEVAYSQVLRIYTNTAFDNSEAWESMVLGEYMYDNWRRRLYSRKRLSEAVDVFRRLLAEGKIRQPRLTHRKAPLWERRAWVQDERQIIWWKLQ